MKRCREEFNFSGIFFNCFGKQFFNLFNFDAKGVNSLSLGLIDLVQLLFTDKTT